MYDQFDINDPQLDFETEQLMLANALKKAQQLQKPQFETYQGQGGIVAPWTPGATIGNALNNVAGRMDQNRIQGDMRNLNQEETRRFQAGMAGLGEIDPNTDFNDPASIAKIHSTQQAKLGGLMNLPMARKMAEQGMIKGMNFPETLAQMKMKQLDAAKAADEKAQLQLQLQGMRGDVSTQNNIRTTDTSYQNNQDRLTQPKVSTDYRYNFETGKAEVIPDSKAAEKLATADADWQSTYGSAKQNMAEFRDTLTSLRDHKYLGTIADNPQMVKARELTDYRTLNRDEYDAYTKFQKVKGELFTEAVKRLKAASANGASGLGQITEKEGARLLQGISSLDLAAGKENVQKEINRLLKELDDFETKADTVAAKRVNPYAATPEITKQLQQEYIGQNSTQPAGRGLPNAANRTRMTPLPPKNDPKSSPRTIGDQGVGYTGDKYMIFTDAKTGESYSNDPNPNWSLVGGQTGSVIDPGAEGEAKSFVQDATAPAPAPAPETASLTVVKRGRRKSDGKMVEKMSDGSIREVKE